VVLAVAATVVLAVALAVVAATGGLARPLRGAVIRRLVVEGELAVRPTADLAVVSALGSTVRPHVVVERHPTGVGGTAGRHHRRDQQCGTGELSAAWHRRPGSERLA
jgi:hypothetical protein